MSNAINIKPEFSVSSEVNNSYVIDSGVEDLNRTLASDGLSSLAFNGVAIEGFDKYYYFKDQSALNEFIAAIQNKENIDLDSAGKPQKDAKFVVIQGRVGIKQSEGAVLNIANPVYQVNPDKKGTFLPISTVNEYAKTQWFDTVKDALFSANNRSSNGRSIKPNNYPSPIFVMGFFAVFFLVFIMVFLLMTKAFANNGNQVAKNKSFSSPTMETIAASVPVLSPNNDQLTQVDNADDFARLQQEQTERMLKQMGVDVNAARDNVGCFTK